MMSNTKGGGASAPQKGTIISASGTEVPPPGYKQTKVGVIPEDWDVVRLKDILKVSQGLQIVISNRFIEPATDRVFYITLPYIEGKKVEYIENPKQSVLCTKEDLLVVRTGSGVGKIVTGVEGAFHNNFFKIKGLDNLNISFIYYFLTESKTKYLMKTYASNGTIPDLPHGDFYSLNCILPPLKEQQKIAQILTTWDDVISKQETLIKAKEELKKGLMQKLLSGEVRFDEFGAGTLVPSNSMEKNGTEVPAPSGWKEVRLGGILTIGSGKDYKHLESGDIPVFGTGGYMLSVNDYLYDGESVCIGRKGTINKPMFLTGKFWTVDTLFYSHSYKNSIPKFLYFSFLQINWKKYNEASGVPSLSKTTIETIKIKLPPLQEQQKIAQVLTLADIEIELLKNELEALKEQKRGLMQRLLSGEVRVKV